MAFVTKSQIPNNGFENWTVYGNGMLPDGWWSTNDSMNSSETYFPITQSTDHYPANVGNYSIRISNNLTYLPNWGGMGLIWPGGWNGNNYPSFPISNHPTSLCGYYKFFPQNSDSMRIFLCLYNNGVEIAQATLMDSTTVSNWTAFTLPIPTYTTADSARIMISSFNADAFQIHGSSVLYVDNLSFDNLITAVKENISDDFSFSLFPNPTSDFVNVNINNKNITKFKLNIYNLMGTLVITKRFRHNYNQINIENLNSGVYIIEVNINGSVKKQKLIIEK